MVRSVEEETVEAPEAEAPAPKAKAKAKTKAKAKAKPAKAKPAKGKAKVAPKVRKEPAGKDAFGLRNGSIRSQAAALYASKKGATLSEVKEAVGSIQLNVLTELKEKGFKITETQEKGDGKRKITRYRLFAK